MIKLKIADFYSVLESDIDHLVCQLYGLTEEETFRRDFRKESRRIRFCQLLALGFPPDTPISL